MTKNCKEIRIRQKHPKLFSRFTTKQLEKGVHAVMGYRDGMTEVQSFVFNREMYDLPKAKGWVRRHNGQVKEHFSASFLNLKYGHIPFTAISEGYLDNIAPTIGFNTSDSKISFDNFKVQILEAIEYPGQSQSTVKRAKVRLIQSGESKNRNIYTNECLSEASDRFNGVPVYFNHKENRDVEEKIGFYSDVTYNNGSLEGIINVFTCEEKAWNMIQAQMEFPNAKVCALSINAFGEGKLIQEGDTVKRLIERITDVISTDMVDTPSAGGKILQVMEAVANRSKGVSMEPTDNMEVKEAFPPKKNASKEPEKAKEKPFNPPVEPDSNQPAPDKADGEAPEAPGQPSDKADEPMAPEDKPDEKPDEMSEEPTEPEAPLVDPAVLAQKEMEVMRAEVHRLMMENEMLKAQLEALTMYESIQKKLSSLDMPDASKERLAEDLKNIGVEKQEGENPSNWDVLIERETNYVKKLSETFKGTEPKVEVELSHARTEVSVTESVPKKDAPKKSINSKDQTILNRLSNSFGL